MGIAVTRSVWNAFSSLALSLKLAAPKAGASSTHSKRFAPGKARAAPQYVIGLMLPSTQRGAWLCAERKERAAQAKQAKIDKLPARMRTRTAQGAALATVALR